MNEIMNKLDEQRLTPADLEGLKSVVDIATRRGAFRGTELTVVGKLYDKLDFAVKVVKNEAEQQLLMEKDKKKNDGLSKKDN